MKMKKMLNKNKKVIAIVVSVSLIVSFSLIYYFRDYLMPSTLIGQENIIDIYPNSITISDSFPPGSKYNVTVRIWDNNDMLTSAPYMAWQMSLIYNYTLVKYSKVYLPTENVFKGLTILGPIVSGSELRPLDNKVFYACTLPVQYTSKCGVFCIVEFEILNNSANIGKVAKTYLLINNEDFHSQFSCMLVTKANEPQTVLAPLGYETTETILIPEFSNIILVAIVFPVMLLAICIRKRQMKRAD